MQKKIWLSGAMAALGAAMLVAAAFAGPASSKSNQPSASGQKKGGTMNINASGTDVDYIDPSLAYGTLSWQILDSVCTKLMYYPDKPDPVGAKLAPDGAVGFPSVSKDGKTYVFTVKSGIKSNTGETLTAANYAAAINRDLNPKMQSPSVPFMTGANGIVGAQAVADGKAAAASGVVAKGQKLTIRLMQPDGSLLSKLAMNFFCPIPKGMPINADGINTFASFGPYYVASRQVGRQLITKTNPNYKGSRPHNISTFVFTMNTNLDQSLLQVKSGQADYDAGGLPATANAGLAQQYGVHKGGALPLLRERRSERRLHRAEHDTAGVLETGHAEGCELRGRPPGSRPGPRLPRGQALAAGPASGYRRLQADRDLPGTRGRTTPRRRRSPRRQAAARTSPSTPAIPRRARTWRRCSSTT